LIFAPVVFAVGFSEIIVDLSLVREGRRSQSRYHSIAESVGITLMLGATCGFLASLPFIYPSGISETLLCAAFAGGLMAAKRVRQRLFKQQADHQP
jgi:hypothetical protein